MSAKYIFVTGGVVSSLGKGLAAASIGCLMESRGLKVTLLKFDPYLNVDPGTMSPFQHGEVFVTDDGAETDLDLGHYERFTHCKLTRDNNWTTGRIYETIIAKERRGDYLGKTVQVIPHVTNEIKSAMKKVAQDVDLAIIEIAGALYRRCRRVENQAHAALREGTAERWDSAGHFVVPHGPLPLERHQVEDRAFLQRDRRGRHYGQGRGLHL